MAEDDGLLAEDDGKKMIMTIPPQARRSRAGGNPVAQQRLSELER